MGKMKWIYSIVQDGSSNAFLDAYKKAIKTDYTIPITVTKNVQDNQLEINFSVEDKPDNIGEDDDYAS